MDGRMRGAMGGWMGDEGLCGGMNECPSLSSYFLTFFLGILSSVFKNDPCMSQSQGRGIGAQDCSGGLWPESPFLGMDSWGCALDAKQPPS